MIEALHASGREADARALLTALHDGMKLVAKAYIAAQDTEDSGVLTLSRFAGAAEQRTQTLVVNPYSRGAPTDAIGTALAMPLTVRTARWRPLMADIEQHDVICLRRRFTAAPEAVQSSSALAG